MTALQSISLFHAAISKNSAFYSCGYYRMLT